MSPKIEEKIVDKKLETKSSKEIIMTKDVERSSEHINIFDLTNKTGANILKIISIYE